MSQDFAWIWIDGAGTAIGTPATVPYNNIANRPAGTKISLNTGTGVVTIADTGFYLVSYGAQPNANVAGIRLALQVNGATLNDQEVTGTTAGGNRFMIGMTAVVQITTINSTLRVQNVGTAFTAASTNASAANVGAFMSIVKLQ
jgi:hypothetical protein